MIGMSASAGAAIEGDVHLAQSISDILSTPIGSRVMRRDYGSALSELIDAPMNGLGRLRIFAAIAVGIGRWEPRIRLTRVDLSADASGTATIHLEGERTDTVANAFTSLTIPLRPAPTA